MLILAVDDEPRMLRLLHRAIEEASPEAEIRDYLLGGSALQDIQMLGLRPDVVFCDILMPGVTGLDLAVRIKSISPDTKLVFVTGHSNYAVDAYRIHASGYVMKPVDAQQIREELAFALPEEPPKPEKLQVRCFGYFEVFWQGEPVNFARKQSKELLAFLVDRRGEACTAEDVITALWEDCSNLKNAKQNIRNLVSDLRHTLANIGMEKVFIRQGSRMAVRPETLDCDYYRMLSGDISAVNRFRGEYMEQFSWAELTKGSLYFHSTN
jgi:two-component SAPR family response regulator